MIKSVLMFMLLLLFFGCVPEEVCIKITSEDLVQVVTGGTVEVSAHGKITETLPLSTVRNELAKAKFLEARIIDTDECLAEFINDYINRSGSLLSNMLDGNCRFSVRTKVDGTNVVAEIEVDEYVLIGTHTALKNANASKKGLYTLSICQTTNSVMGSGFSFEAFFCENKFWRDKLRNARTVIANIKDADNIGYTFLNLMPLLHPMWYRRQSFLFIGDSKNYLYVNGAVMVAPNVKTNA